MPSDHRIAAETFYVGKDTAFYQGYSFVYDGSRRLIYKLQLSGGVPDTIERYTYFSNKIVLNSVEIMLNDRGLAASSSAGGPSYAWEYNSEGYTSRETYTYAGGSYVHTYNYTCFNNDKILAVHQSSIGATNDTTFFTFNDKSNTTGNLNHGISFYGRQSNTLVLTSRSTGETLVTYSYVYDSMNRVQWEIRTDNVGHKYFIKYTYL
jgi:hypothetical protein